MEIFIALCKSPMRDEACRRCLRNPNNPNSKPCEKYIEPDYLYSAYDNDDCMDFIDNIYDYDSEVDCEDN